MQHGKSWDYVEQSIENTTSMKSTTIIIIIKHVWWNHEYYFSRSKTSQFFSYKNISLPIKLIFKCSQMVPTQGSRSTRFTATSRLSTFFLNIFLPHVLRNQLKIWTDIQKHIHIQEKGFILNYLFPFILDWLTYSTTCMSEILLWCMRSISSEPKYTRAFKLHTQKNTWHEIYTYHLFNFPGNIWVVSETMISKKTLLLVKQKLGTCDHKAHHFDILSLLFSK